MVRTPPRLWPRLENCSRPKTRKRLDDLMPVLGEGRCFFAPPSEFISSRRSRDGYLSLRDERSTTHAQ